MPEHKNSGPGSRNQDPGLQNTLKREAVKPGHSGFIRVQPKVSVHDPFIGISILGSGGGVYRVAECLGKGGMGSVYMAEQTLEDGSRRSVAVKFLSQELCKDRELLERFRKEAEALRKIDHPNVVKILDTGALENGNPFFVMEHVEGEDLDKMLERRKRLPWDEARPIMLQVCDGLHAAHAAGLIHRDLKPSNIRLGKGGGPAKVMDFGVAKHTHMEKKLTMTGTTLGTPDYMAPEQAGGKQLDLRADIYSLSAVMYSVLTGSAPFDGDSLQEIMFKQVTDNPVPPRKRRPDLAIPEDVEEMIMCGLRKDPKERFQSMVEFREAILKCGEDSQAPLSFPPPEFDKKGLVHGTEGFFSRRAVALIAAAVAVAALGAAAYFGLQKYHFHPRQATYLKADGTRK